MNIKTDTGNNRIAESEQHQIYDLDLDESMSGFTAFLAFPPLIPARNNEASPSGRDRRMGDRRIGDRRQRAREYSVREE